MHSNAHRDEGHRVHGNEDDEVRPAVAPLVLAGDEVLALIAAILARLHPLLLELIRQIVDHHHNGCFFIHNSFELLFVLFTLDGFMEGLLVLLTILLDLLPFALEVVIPELIAVLLVHLHVLVCLEHASQIHARTLLF